MSRHIFTTEYDKQPVEIVMGWDRPLHGFFMTIEKVNDRGNFVFSNLESFPSHPRDLKVFLNKLNELGLLNAVPEVMIDEVLLDGVCNRGNKTVNHKIVDGKYHKELLG